MGSSKRRLQEANNSSTEVATRPSKKRKSEKKDGDGNDKKSPEAKAAPPLVVPDSSNEDDELLKQKAEAKAAKKDERRRMRKERKEFEKEQRRREKKEQKEREEREEKIEAKKEKAAGDEYDSTYAQAKALSALAQSDIDAFLAKEAINVNDPDDAADHQSANLLRPILDFAYLPHTALLAEHPFSAYDAPTPIQAASWPYTLSGRDVIGVAETGSGKTMAFALPCIESVVRACAAAQKNTKKKPKGRKTIHAVIVSPTRELAMQTHTQMVSLAGHVGLECVCLFGGASKETQKVLLQRADIVVATPGRLKDFMADGTADLSSTAFVVLDEADRMLDKGFEEDIRQILGQTPPREERQTLMFTATWPESVRVLASTFMVRPVKITIGSANRETASGAVELQANARINQRVEIVDSYGKEGRVLQIIKAQQQGKNKFDRILVFCLYKKEATRIESFLGSKGIKVASIHGDLRQEQRTRSLEAFKSGQTPVLVATDVAARGLDIPEVKLVLNVTFPLTIEDYVHRIGRTGRAGKSGEAITLFTQQDKAHSGSLVNILRSANQPVPDDLLKFGTTVKKKVHPIYGAFFKDQGPNKSDGPAKIKFDD